MECPEWRSHVSACGFRKDLTFLTSLTFCPSRQDHGEREDIVCFPNGLDWTWKGMNWTARIE